MRALLDTHTFLWWNTNHPLLSSRVRAIIANGENELFLSAASAWEIAIKAGRGRLQLPESPDKYLSSRMVLHRIQPLPIQLSHALQVYHLPPHHPDPFDRLLIAQSQLESIPILTIDTQFGNYEVEVVW
ncbi:MAG: type II toxin-antitoxin system VapC family toxin [Anaerolineales bacterium]